MQLIEGLFCLERKGLGCSVLPVITPVHHQGLLVYTHCEMYKSKPMLEVIAHMNYM